MICLFHGVLKFQRALSLFGSNWVSVGVLPPAVKWEDVNCLVPGLLYGDPSHAGGGVPTRTSNSCAKRFSIREDYMSALFGVSFLDGNWAGVLDVAPRGDTTQANTITGRSLIDKAAPCIYRLAME